MAPIKLNSPKFLTAFLVSMFFCITISTAQQHNRVETFTTANGLSSNGSVDILREPDGTVWVAHESYNGAGAYNYNFPLSKRTPDGVWSQPSLANVPVVVINGWSHNIFRFRKMFRTADGRIWFIPKEASVQMNPPPPSVGSQPLIVYENGSFSAMHPALNNFPDKGGVIDMTQDKSGNIWFGCKNGLIKMTPAGAFTTYNAPNAVFTPNSGNTTNYVATEIVSIDVDNSNNVVMVVAGQFNYVRRFKPATNEWDLWTLQDAPWWNASQADYRPIQIKASGDKLNTLWITTVGGGLYYIKQGDFDSNERTQVADFLHPPIWGTWGWAMEIINTNIPQFCSRMFVGPYNEFWIIGSNLSASTDYAYKFERKVNDTYLYNGLPNPATRYMYSIRGSQFSFNDNGFIQKAHITSMSFAPNNQETWVATRQGVERWYSHYPLPDTGSIIGIKGAGLKKIGITAFNTMSNNLPEPPAVAHTLNPGIPSISIDSAYYYLSTTDYDKIDSTINAGLQGDGFVRGFPTLTTALQTHNLTGENIKIRFTPVSLGNDVSGVNEDWTYSVSQEKRKYQKRIQVDNGKSQIRSHYEILLDSQIMFRGVMPNIYLGIGYNKYGYLTDSIAAHTDDVHLTKNLTMTEQAAIDVADAIEADLGTYGVRFVFQSIQSANDTSLVSAGRRGGLFSVTNAYLRKSDTSLVPLQTMAGIYRIGNSAEADFSSINNAVQALQTNGVSGWVTFEIEDGTYYEQFSIAAIAGTQDWDNRPITFRSLSNDSTKVIIQFSPTQGSNNYIFKNDGVKNLIFEKLHFINTSSILGRVFNNNVLSQNFILRNCIVEGEDSAPATIDNDLLFSTAQLGGATITNNVFKNGNRALYLLGSNITIKANKFYGHKNYAISFGTVAVLPNVIGNEIYGPSTGTFSGISMGTATDKFLVEKNKIINQLVPGIVGINCSFSAVGGVVAADNALIANNEVSMLTGSTTIGIVAQSENAAFYHNTVLLTGNQANSVALRAGLSRGNTKIENNIFSNPNGYAMATYPFSGYYPQTNRNIYYGSANPLKIHTTTNSFTNYSTVAAISAVSGRDANSMIANPQFLSDAFLVPQNAAVYNLAPTIAVITTDIRNQVRPNTNRDHGAYEFNSWSGNQNSDWSTAANWTDARVPDAIGMAIFPTAGVTNDLIVTTPISIHKMFVAAGRNITIKALQQLNITGSLTNNGIIKDSGNLVFMGGEQQVLEGNGTIDNLVINSSNNVTIATGSQNNIGVIKTLDVQQGTLITNDNLTLKSSNSFTARLLPITIGNIAGEVTVERFIPAKRAWRAIATPLKGNTNNSIFYNWQNNDSIIANRGIEIWHPSPIGNVDPSLANSGLAIGGGASMLTYNNGWQAVNNTNTTELFNNNGSKGFMTFVTGPYQNGNGNILGNNSTETVLAAKGNLITGTHSVNNLTSTQFHLVGNPYASTIDFALLQRTNLQNRFWIWDPNRIGANSVGGYILFDVNTQTTVPATPAGSYNNYTSLIQSGQAFFVYAENGLGSIQFNEQNKTTNANDVVFRNANTNLQKLNIGLYRHINQTPQFSDGITAVFDDNGDDSVSSKDALKLLNGADNISFSRYGTLLMLERRPLITNTDTLHINIAQTINTTYELRIKGEQLNTNLTAVLLDAYLNTSTVINLIGETVYVFDVTADVASKGNRFKIAFKQTSVLSLNNLVLHAEATKNNIQVKWNVTGEYDLEKYIVEKSTTGIVFKEIYNTKASNETGSKEYSSIDENPNYGANYYRIKAIGKDGSYVYSNIVNVTFTKAGNSFTVYPNPAKIGATIQLQSSDKLTGNVQVGLLQIDGKKVWQQQINIAQTQILKVQLPTTLTPGKYIIELTQTNGKQLHQSILIQ